MKLDTPGTVQLGVRVSPELARVFKEAVLARGLTMHAAITQAIGKWVASNRGDIQLDEPES